MAVSEAPTLVAQLGTQGWQVLQANAPAQAQWPALHAGAPLSTTQPTPEADNFSFTVSHDLRAPIRVVEGFTRIVKEDYGRQLDRVGNDHLDRVLALPRA
jgi:signal transduction histidine kinase